MATTGSNAKYAFKYFVQNPQENAIKFHQNLAKDLICNKLVPESEWEEEKGKKHACKKMKIDQCQHVTLPPFSVVSGAQVLHSQGKYNKRVCNSGQQRVYAYFECLPGTMICDQCYAEHVTYIKNACHCDKPN
eukprot:3266272-Ditylum_brightwellii.AAC.1